MEQNTIIALFFGMEDKKIIFHLDTIGVKIDMEKIINGVRFEDDVISLFTSDGMQVFFEIANLHISYSVYEDDNTIEYFIDNNNGVIVEIEEQIAP